MILDQYDEIQAKSKDQIRQEYEVSSYNMKFDYLHRGSKMEGDIGDLDL